MVPGRSLLFRIVLVFAILVVGGLALGSLVIEQHYLSQSNARLASLVKQNVDSVRFSLDSLLGRISVYSRMTMAGGGVQKFLSSPHRFQDPSLLKAATRLFYETLGNFPEVDSVYLVDNEGQVLDLIRRSGVPPALMVADHPAWMAAAAAAQGGSVFLTETSDLFSPRTGPSFLACARQVNDLYRQVPVGYIVFTVPMDLLDRTMNPGSEAPVYLRLLDAQGRVIHTSGTPPGKDVTSESLTRGTARVTLAALPWTLEGTMTLDPLPQEGQDFRPVIMLLLVVFAVASFLAALFVGSMVRRPVNALLASMDKNVGGVLEDAPTGSDIVEFVRLTDGYNRLLGRIRTLMADTIQGQELLREKELALLFAQLKPHFLYNTLDSLSALALLGRNQDLHRMVSALASFYRLSLSGGQEVIPLGDELSIVRNYETIQRIRYDDLFRIEYRVPPEALGIPLPRLLLQPLVENALYHGIRPAGRKGLIVIQARLENGLLTLEVEDDGVGIDAARGKELIRAAEEGKGGLGLRASVHRLKVLYGDRGSFALSPREPRGTRVTVVVPGEDADGYA